MTGVTSRNVQFSFRVLPLTQLFTDVTPRIKLISLRSNKAPRFHDPLGRAPVPCPLFRVFTTLFLGVVGGACSFAQGQPFAAQLNSERRRPDCNFSELNTQPTHTSVYASLCISRCPAQNSRPSGSLPVSPETLAFSTSCRFIPAHEFPFSISGRPVGYPRPSLNARSSRVYAAQRVAGRP